MLTGARRAEQGWLVVQTMATDPRILPDDNNDFRVWVVMKEWKKLIHHQMLTFHIHYQLISILLLIVDDVIM